MVDAPLTGHRGDTPVRGDNAHLTQQGRLIGGLGLGQRGRCGRTLLDRVQAPRSGGSLGDGLGSQRAHPRAGPRDARPSREHGGLHRDTEQPGPWVTCHD